MRVVVLETRTRRNPFPSNGRFVSSFFFEQQEDTAAMEQIADAIMQIPPNAMDRQRALTLLAHCDKLARNGRPRVASKYAMNCGAMLFKLGPPVAPLTEAVFQRAVFGEAVRRRCSRLHANTLKGTIQSWETRSRGSRRSKQNWESSIKRRTITKARQKRSRNTGTSSN